jgi:hypothetical protein
MSRQTEGEAKSEEEGGRPELNYIVVSTFLKLIFEKIHSLVWG